MTEKQIVSNNFERLIREFDSLISLDDAQIMSIAEINKKFPNGNINHSTTLRKDYLDFVENNKYKRLAVSLYRILTYLSLDNVKEDCF